MVVTMNDTCDEEPYNITEAPSQAAIISKGLFLTICVTLSLVCNILCLVVLNKVRDRSLQNVTKIFMISFTFCDIFGIVFVYIPMTVSTFMYEWPFGDILCIINGFASTIFAYTSGIQLLALNLERYLALSYPLKWYNVYVTPRKARIVVVCLWSSAVIFSVVAYFAIPDRYTVYSPFWGICNSNPCGHEPDVSGTILSTLFFILPVLITLFLWMKTYLVAKRHAQAIINQVRSVGTLERSQLPSVERKYSQTSLGSLGSLDSPCRSPVRKEMDRKASKTSTALRTLGGTLDRRKASKASTTELQAASANRRAFFTFFCMSICMALINLPFITVIVYDNTQRKMLPYGYVAVSQLLIVSFGFLNVIIYYARNKAFRKTAKKLFCTPADPYSRPSRAFVTNTNGKSIGQVSARFGSREDMTEADV